MSNTGWLLDVPAQQAFQDGAVTEIQPTKRQWDFFGIGVEYNPTSQRVEVRGVGGLSGVVFGGSSGRQQSDDVSAGFLDIGAMVVDLSSFPSGATITFEAVLSTNNSPTIPAEVRLMNLTTSQVITASTLSTTSGTMAKVSAVITPDATFDDTAEQLIAVQLRKSAVGAASDLAFCDLAQLRVSY